MINKLAEQIYQNNVRVGWWPEQRSKELYAMKIALIHSEVSEMLEGLRKGEMDTHLPHRKTEEVEAADILIRLLDYAAARELDLEAAILEKLEYNTKREDHKIESRKLQNGKAF